MSNYSEQFLKQNPLAVLGILRDLQKSQAPIRLSWGGWQFISRILDASPEQLVLDFGSQASENQAVQKAKNIQFSAEAQGAKVEFNLPALNVGEFQNLPAFVAPLPEAVWFVQRREHFRITAPVQPQFYSLARMPDGKLFRGRCRICRLAAWARCWKARCRKGWKQECSSRRWSLTCWSGENFVSTRSF